MVKTLSASHGGRPRPHPARLAFRYAIAGLAWVGASEFLLAELPLHSAILNRILFVSVTSVLLFIVASRYAHSLQVSLAVRDEALARGHAYFESSVEGIVTTDAEGLIRHMNSRAQELFGYGELELLGEPVERLLPERYRGRHPSMRGGFIAEGRSRAMGLGKDLAAQRKDGSEFPVEIALNRMMISRGEFVVAFITDITARRAMEREARRSETLNALGSVAAGIAHELNNPLAIIASRIEVMLMAGSDLPEELRTDLAVLQRNVERASRISHNLLSLARQRPGERQAMDLNAAVEDAVLLLRGDSRRAPIAFKLELDRKLPPLLVEQTGIEQVLINLVSNAHDAGASSVVIRSEMDPSHPGYLRLMVTDDGHGVGAETLGHLFQPFFTTKPKGTGLGLWLSRRLIEDHGGTVEVDSKEGRGTTFIITLPTIEAGLTPLPQESHAAK